MKLAIAAIAAIMVTSVSADAQTRVRGYVKRDGTYVAPHVRSSPNRTTFDNYSTRPNVNPYTGEPGTQEPTYPSYRPSTPTYRPYTPPKRCTGIYC